MPKSRVCFCSRAGALGALYYILKISDDDQFTSVVHQVGGYEELVIMSSQIPELKQHRRRRAWLLATTRVGSLDETTTEEESHQRRQLHITSSAHRGRLRRGLHKFMQPRFGDHSWAGLVWNTAQPFSKSEPLRWLECRIPSSNL
jgi:hypothetical protein